MPSQPSQDNLAALEASGHLHAWVADHPQGWNDGQFRHLMALVDETPFSPIHHEDLGLAIEKIKATLDVARSDQHPAMATGFVEVCLSHRPRLLEGPDFDELLETIVGAGFGPIEPEELQQMVSLRYRVQSGPRRTAHVAPTVDRVHSADRLADAEWADPYDIVDSFAWRPGDFWLGRCPISDVALGYRDDKHVLLVGGTRGGKGTSFIVPNHCLWRGSLFSIDPKGENANVTAARRGAGNDVCVGMGQAVYVLDPLNESSVADEYRSGFNPLSELDPRDPEVAARASELAEALVLRGESEDGASKFFNDKAKDFLKGLILHVKTWDRFDEHERHLGTVADLAAFGDPEFAGALNEVRAAEDDAAGRKGKDRRVEVSPREALLQAMAVNESVGPGGKSVPAVAAEILELRENKAGDQLGGLFTTLKEQLAFLLDSPGIRDNLSRDDFRMSDLHAHPDGISVYLVIPFGKMQTYNRWLRLLTTCAVRAMLESRAQPACGHNVLFCLDEFPQLGYMRVVEQGLSTLAGYNVTMLVVVQYLQQLREEHYKKSWNAFHQNSGLEVYFDVGDSDAEQLSKWIGETDLVVHARNANLSASGQESAGASTSRSQTEGGSDANTTGRTVGGGESISTTDTVTNTKSVADGRTEGSGTTDTVTQTLTNAEGGSQSVGGGTQEGGSEGIGRTDSRGGGDGGQSGVSHGRQAGTSRNAHSGSSHGYGGGGGSFSRNSGAGVGSHESHSYQVNEGRNWNRNWSEAVSQNRGRNWSQSANWNKGENWNRSVADGCSLAETHNRSRTLTQTQSEAIAHAEGRTKSSNWSEQNSSTHTDSYSSTNQVGANLGVNRGRTAQLGISQTVVKRPLITTNTLKESLDPRSGNDPNIIGFGLVRMGGRRATIVVRTPYYRDLGFDGLYDRHPRHPESDPPPVVRPIQVLLDRDADTETPIFGHEDEHGTFYESRVAMWCCTAGERVRPGQTLYMLSPGICEAFGFADRISVYAPFAGHVSRLEVPGGGAVAPSRILAVLDVHLADLWEGQQNLPDNFELDRLGRGDHPVFARAEAIRDARATRKQAEWEEQEEAEFRRRTREAETERGPRVEATSPDAEKLEEKRRRAFVAWHEWTPVIVAASLIVLGITAVVALFPSYGPSAREAVGKPPHVPEYIPTPPWYSWQDEEDKERYTREFRSDRLEFYRSIGYTAEERKQKLYDDILERNRKHHDREVA